MEGFNQLTNIKQIKGRTRDKKTRWLGSMGVGVVAVRRSNSAIFEKVGCGGGSVHLLINY